MLPIGTFDDQLTVPQITATKRTWETKSQEMRAQLKARVASEHATSDETR